MCVKLKTHNLGTGNTSEYKLIQQQEHSVMDSDSVNKAEH